MRCPYCNDPETRVVDSRETSEGREIRRRRECAECSRRFTTRERYEERAPRIIKRGGRIEEYAREKLELSVEKACANRPITENTLTRVVDCVERRFSEIGEPELTSVALGELVLEELVELDALAATRFASVFRDFNSPADFREFFEEIERRRRDAER